MSTHPNRDLLYGMSIDEQEDMPRQNLLALRRSVYAEHARQMEPSAAIAQWVAQMKLLCPGGVKVWENELGWAEALLVVRYGEDTRHWPSAFSAGDVLRATNWMKGKIPTGVTHLKSTQDMTLVSAAFLVAGLVGFMATMGTDGWMSLLFLPFLFGSAMTDFLENKLADHLFRTTTYSQPSVLAVGLFTAAPGETGGGTEVSGGSYARVQRNPSDSNWRGTHASTSGASSGTGGVVDNAAVLTFPSPTANWGTVSHQGLFDATTSGNLLIYGALTQSKTVNNGDPAPNFPANALTFTFA